jgi:hypothetical protein
MLSTKRADVRINNILLENGTGLNKRLTIYQKQMAYIISTPITE